MRGSGVTGPVQARARRSASHSSAARIAEPSARACCLCRGVGGIFGFPEHTCTDLACMSHDIHSAELTRSRDREGRRSISASFDRTTGTGRFLLLWNAAPFPQTLAHATLRYQPSELEREDKVRPLSPSATLAPGIAKPMSPRGVGDVSNAYPTLVRADKLRQSANPLGGRPTFTRAPYGARESNTDQIRSVCVLFCVRQRTHFPIPLMLDRRTKVFNLVPAC